jgi:hypothetical protein
LFYLFYDSCKENQTSNSECKMTEETVNSEANGDVSILTLPDPVQTEELIADIMASNYIQADADEMATPVETPKEF